MIRQTWQRTVPGSDVVITRLYVDVDDQGRATIHEAVLGQLLLAVGWERADTPNNTTGACT